MPCLVSVSRRIGDFTDVIAQISQPESSQLSVGARHEVRRVLTLCRHSNSNLRGVVRSLQADHRRPQLT